MDTLEAKAKEARIPRAQLLPLSLDVPVVPPRPEPKGLTMPRPFNLRSEVTGGQGVCKGVRPGHS